ncbi:hypothetical protein VTL71DRAFT_14302 [Oculimacula yallundae]|uniref:Zn(2)-C6 fungal-type domain-containing protein n=1 Tax=Oculimacula yallundae TaxID=86028 RepID=A0ABR4CK66_9HELO
MAIIKRKIASKPKVKTGCKTCRIRKVKCDENKPSCKKCLSTGRKCDGYDSPFKAVTIQELSSICACAVDPDSELIRSTAAVIRNTSQLVDIDLLNRYFSTKTLFDVTLDCKEEARQISLASLTDPSVRQAVSSLKTLRENLQIAGDGPISLAQPTRSFQYGLQQYSMALGGLATNLLSPNPEGVRSALLCCQIFISIEQVQKNYSAMIQHIIRGLRIMHECRARPCFTAMNEFVVAHDDQLPLLDVFIVKLFIAPCKFADLSTAATDRSVSTESACSPSSHRQYALSHELRTIAPDVHTDLKRIATMTLEFLSKVSRAKPGELAIHLRSEKAVLLDNLQTWLNSLERVQTEIGCIIPEPLSVSFLRLLNLILEIILLGTLDSLPNDFDTARLQAANTRLQQLADEVTKRCQQLILRSNHRISICFFVSELTAASNKTQGVHISRAHGRQASKGRGRTEPANQHQPILRPPPFSPNMVVFWRVYEVYITTCIPLLLSRSNLSTYLLARVTQQRLQQQALSLRTMHFLLLGASGRTGQHVVSELLSQGHTAVALVRTAKSITPHNGLTIVAGSPLSKADIRSAFVASPILPTAAIITLNTVRKTESPFAAQLSPPRFLADSCANACEVLEQAGVRRIVVMSTAGAGDSWANLPMLSKAFMGWTNVKYALADHNLVDKEIRMREMDWTLVRASKLQFDTGKTTDADMEIRTLGSEGNGMSLTDSVTVASVARFLLKVAVEGLFIKSAVVVAN